MDAHARSCRRQNFGGRSDNMDPQQALEFEKAAVKEHGWDNVVVTKPRLKAAFTSRIRRRALA
eukprot:6111711-Pyramimonas_sp.AAC.1